MVFGGYGNPDGTKKSEQLRMYQLINPVIQVLANTPVYGNEEWLFE